MKYCQNCGTEVGDARFCQSCGANVAEEAQNSDNYSVFDNGQNQGIPQGFTNFSDSQEYNESQDIQNNKMMAVLSYLGVLALIPLFVAKESKFARFHLNQGLILWIAYVAWRMVVYKIIYVALLSTLPWTAWLTVASIIGLVNTAVVILLGVLCVMGIVHACQGKTTDLPILNKLKFKIIK